MLYAEQKLKQALKNGASVFYFYSTDPAQVQRVEQPVLKHFRGEDADETVLDGPNPSIEEIIVAAGTISFFGTRRLVHMPFLKPSAYSDKDLKDLCETLEQAENAVFVITSIIAEDRGKPKIGKREQKLMAKCEACGYCAQVMKPQKNELVRILQQKAASLGAELRPDAAQRMIERSGESQYLLENEVDKLAALADYETITVDLVEKLGTQSLEADVFDMTRFVTSGQVARALERLNVLLRMQNEPIAITGALISNYLDLYRVCCTLKARKDIPTLQQSFGYRGSPYRLNKAAETARRFSKAQLYDSLKILAELEKGLKGSPVDNEILMQKAICQLADRGRA